MKAVVIHATGGPEQLAWPRCPIRCRARRSADRRRLCGLQLGRHAGPKGIYPHAMTYPMVLGFEVSGTVSRSGRASPA